MSNFRAIDRETGYLLPPSVDEWLPEKHLARFIVDVIDGLDLGRMSRAYRGTGSAIEAMSAVRALTKPTSVGVIMSVILLVNPSPSSSCRSRWRKRYPR